MWTSVDLAANKKSSLLNQRNKVHIDISITISSLAGLLGIMYCVGSDFRGKNLKEADFAT